MERPQFGAVSPATFIPLAEENGLIQEIGEWVLTTACFQAKHWEDVFPGMRMSVNVSPRQLACDRFANVVGRALANSGLPAQRLELEITEGALIAPNALPSLRALSQMGVSIATLFSGVELCAAIRQDQSLCHFPVIAVPSMELDRIGRPGLFDVYLRKPVSPDQLISAKPINPYSRPTRCSYRKDKRPSSGLS